jgi:hypothetical protein
VVNALSLGTATITATSTWNNQRKGSATVKVGSPCAIPVAITVPGSATGTVNAASCLGTQEQFGYTITGSMALTATATAPFSFEFAPLVARGFSYTRAGFPAGSGSLKLLVGPGTYQGLIYSSPAGGLGNVSLSFAPWDKSGCWPRTWVTSNIAFTQLSVLSACNSIAPPNAPLGTYWSTGTLELSPILRAGETITVKATGRSGFAPRIVMNVGGTITSAVAPTGSAVATLTSTSTGQAFIWVTSRDPQGTGQFDLEITGPPSTLPRAVGAIGATPGGTSIRR